MSDSLQSGESQHARPPYPSPTPKFTQTYVHWVGDAIQSSHPLSSPSPLTFNLSQHQDLFQWVSFHIRWPKYWSFSFSSSTSNEYSWLISFRTDWFDLCCPRDSQESSLAPQFENISSPVLSLLSSPTLTSVHDYWKNHSFDQMDLPGLISWLWPFLLCDLG